MQICTMDTSEENEKPKPSGFRMNLKTKKKKQPSASKRNDDEQSTFFEKSLPTSQEERVSVQEFDGKVQDGSGTSSSAPLVIPVIAPNSLGGKSRLVHRDDDAKPIKQEAAKKDDDEDNDDAKAIRALQQEAEDPSGPSSSRHEQNKDLVIAAAKDQFQRPPSQQQQQQEHRETQQFQQDLEKLPDAMDVDDYQQSRVPISEFGAAMLRGMGWTGEDGSDKSKNDKEPSLPRPHRLGLGATPAPPAGLDDDDNDENGNRRRKPRTMDQYERDKKLKKQAQEFARQRQRQVESDKQQTLQDGSLVLLTNGKRAKLVQIAGVPGLNQVRIQYEHDGDVAEVKKGLIDRLLGRNELQDRPFVEGKQAQRQGDSSDRHKENSRRGSDERSSARGGDERKRRRDRDDERHRDDDDRRKRDGKRSEKRDYDDYEYDSKRRTSDDRRRPSHDEDRKKRRRKEEDREYDRERKQSSYADRRRHDKSSSSSWVIPHIRVRIVTEKLGRRYFKEKGVVVDVTPKGSTVEMPSGGSSGSHRVVLDRVPERYLETALPKAGGRVVVLTASEGREYLYSKGTLLERGKGRGVVQLNADKSVLTLSLDDLAEWMGPFEEDE